MAGCVPCFIIPLLLFIFHRYIQPLILKFWNPWEDKAVKPAPEWNGWSCPLVKKNKKALDSSNGQINSSNGPIDSTSDQLNNETCTAPQDEAAVAAHIKGD